MKSNNDQTKFKSNVKGIASVVFTLTLLGASFVLKDSSKYREQATQIETQVSTHIVSEGAAGGMEMIAAGVAELTGENKMSDEEKKAAEEKAAAREERKNELYSDYFVFGNVENNRCDVDAGIAFRWGDSFYLRKGIGKNKSYNWAMYVDDGEPEEIWCSSEKLTEDMLTPGSSAVMLDGKKIKSKHYTF